MFNHLPITTFCWLPPESDETGSCGSLVLIWRSATWRAINGRSSARDTRPEGAILDRLAMQRLSAVDNICTKPTSLRFSGV
ncbi:hypothetical protein D9M69_732070 [compost metagenome]